jgi:hypothetical protein
MPTDVFNNPSNDYINPGLSPCADAADEYDFKFLPRQEAGITSGASILQSLNLGDIVVPITSWTSEKKYVASGEVVYVPGLTKGLENKSQRFVIPIASPLTDQELFMQLDVSINYYYNFRYFNIDIDSSANHTLGIDIANAVNTNFGTRNTGVSVSYDVSAFTFGGAEGFEFNVTNVLMTLIDASMDSASPFVTVINASTGDRVPQTYALAEDASSAIPSAKYPNGAMRGYMLKTYFPTTAVEADKWFYMNSVKSPFTMYEASTGSGFVKYSKAVDVGMNGAGNSATMSAAEYLDYITTYNLWDKVGDFRAHISSVDPADSNVANLVGGFYMFNPHEFAIMVEYMMIN